jgi:hypothetical protein
MQTWSSGWGEQPIEHADEVTLARKRGKEPKTHYRSSFEDNEGENSR